MKVPILGKDPNMDVRGKVASHMFWSANCATTTQIVKLEDSSSFISRTININVSFLFVFILWSPAVRLGSHWTDQLLEKCSTILFTTTVPLIVGRPGKPIMPSKLHLGVSFLVFLTLVSLCSRLQEGIRRSIHLWRPQSFKFVKCTCHGYLAVLYMTTS